MDRATGFYPVGWGFESLRAHKVVALQHVFASSFPVDRNADPLRVETPQVGAQRPRGRAPATNQNVVITTACLLED